MSMEPNLKNNLHPVHCSDWQRGNFKTNILIGSIESFLYFLSSNAIEYHVPTRKKNPNSEHLLENCKKSTTPCLLRIRAIKSILSLGIQYWPCHSSLIALFHPNVMCQYFTRGSAECWVLSKFFRGQITLFLHDLS